MIRRGKVVMFIAESIRTMPATLFATITTTQKIATGKDHQAVFKVVVLALDEHVPLVILFHHSRTRSLRPLGQSVRASETRSQNIPDQRDCLRNQRNATAAGHHPTAASSSLPDPPS